MTNWFCSVFNVVCVVNVCPVHAVDLNGLSSSLDKNAYKDPYLYCLFMGSMCNNQTWFRRKDCAIDLVNNIEKSVDKSLEVQAIFVGILKASIKTI